MTKEEKEKLRKHLIKKADKLNGTGFFIAYHPMQTVHGFDTQGHARILQEINILDIIDNLL